MGKKVGPRLRERGLTQPFLSLISHVCTSELSNCAIQFDQEMQLIVPYHVFSNISSKSVRKFTQQVLELLDEVHGVLLVEVVHLRGPLLLLLGGLLPAVHLYGLRPGQRRTLPRLQAPEAPAEGHPGVPCGLCCEVGCRCCRV